MSNLCFLPLYQTHARNVLHVDEAMFGMDNIICGSDSADVRWHAC